MVDNLGLRQRKKMAAMRRIQEVALDLFDERGFEDVTIEEIAEAAEVSPSTVYRYFGTKERVVLLDEFEPLLMEAIESELASHPPVEAVRRAISGIMTEFFDRDEELAIRRTRYSLDEPALRATELEQMDDFAQEVAEMYARATARQPHELEVQVAASMLVASMMAAVRHWHAGGYRTPLRKQLDTALDMVENGLT